MWLVFETIISWYYRGNISISVSSFAVDSKKGHKIAQITFLQKEEVTFEKVVEFDDTTIRGTKGFGSTDSKRVQFFLVKKR